MIADGFGNDLSIDEVLARVEPFIGIVEAERHNEAVDRDDVMQEARIAVWQATRRQPENLRPYLIATIKQRTTGAITRQDWLGRPSRQGRQDPDALTATEPLEDALMLTGADLLSSVEMAYHHGELVAAIAELRPHEREYVYLRFWLGMTEPEIAAAKGTTAKTENGLWNRSIRPQLVRALAHLA